MTRKLKTRGLSTKRNHGPNPHSKGLSRMKKLPYSRLLVYALLILIPFGALSICAYLNQETILDFIKKSLDKQMVTNVLAFITGFCLTWLLLLLAFRYLSEPIKNFVSKYIYLLLGIIALAVDLFMNLEFIYSLEKGITSLVIAVFAAALICVFCLPASIKSFASRTASGIIAGIMLLAVFLSLSAFSIGASIYRAGDSYDKNVTEAKTKNLAQSLAEKELDADQKDYTAKNNAVLAES